MLYSWAGICCIGTLVIVLYTSQSILNFLNSGWVTLEPSCGGFAVHFERNYNDAGLTSVDGLFAYWRIANTWPMTLIPSSFSSSFVSCEATDGSIWFSLNMSEYLSASALGIPAFWRMSFHRSAITKYDAHRFSWLDRNATVQTTRVHNDWSTIHLSSVAQCWGRSILFNIDFKPIFGKYLVKFFLVGESLLVGGISRFWSSVGDSPLMHTSQPTFRDFFRNLGIILNIFKEFWCQF